MMFM